MKNRWFGVLVVAALAGMPVGCSHLSPDAAIEDSQRSEAMPGRDGGAQSRGKPGPVPRAIQSVKDRFAPDSHLAVFTIGIQRQSHGLVLTGEVSDASAKVETVRAVERTGVKVLDRITVLPGEELGDEVWGIACLSVASGREKPDHKAEMGTQVLMGHSVRVWKGTTHWFLVQSADGYLTWLEKGSFVRYAMEQLDAWARGPLLIVTAFEDRVMDQPQTDAEEVSDVVMGNLVTKTGEEGDWFKIRLPDQRTGFLQKKSAEDYGAWKQSRQPTPQNIERTARLFLGRPYLWGGNSPKGLDCSGFTKLVFSLNGIELSRNASEQARQGMEMPVDADFGQLKKGDLLCFGSRARRNRPEWISHVGIYLGGKLFIQSSQRVRISSLDPNSPIYDERHGRMRIYARRVLKD